MPKVEVGSVFERLTVLHLESVPDSKGRNFSQAFVQCECGTLKLVRTNNLQKGNVKSCGCLRREVTGNTHRKHGQSMDRNRIGTPTYKTWSSMKSRCGKVHHYADVSVCERWSDFEAFLADMGERPDGMTLDRIDPAGNYEPSNCRWATLSDQSANRKPWEHSPEGIVSITRNLPHSRQ